MAKKLKIGLINLLLLKLSFAQSISELQLKYQKVACKVLEKSYQTCFEASRRLNVFKDDEGCNELSVEIFSATVEEYKKTDKVFLELAKRASLVCYKACMGEEDVLSSIREECSK